MTTIAQAITETADLPNPQAITPLVAAILQQTANDNAYLTNALLDGYQADLDTARATLAAIRDTIRVLFAGPYMPTPSAVIACLYPTAEEINQCRTTTGE